jgi:hypothetical protein
VKLLVYFLPKRPLKYSLGLTIALKYLHIYPLKNPDKPTLHPAVLAVDIATDVALQRNFDEDSSLDLAQRIDDLYRLILEDDEYLPDNIDNLGELISKSLLMIDIAYACWTNDEPIVPLDEEVLLGFVVRMKLNPEHCKNTLKFTRMRLKMHGKLVAPKTWSLLDA